jgi:hypothetical protein
MHIVNRGIKKPKDVGYFCNLKKVPRVNNDPTGENSPNLVTLVIGDLCYDFLNIFAKFLGEKNLRFLLKTKLNYAKY